MTKEVNYWIKLVFYSNIYVHVYPNSTPLPDVILLDLSDLGF